MNRGKSIYPRYRAPQPRHFDATRDRFCVMPLAPAQEGIFGEKFGGVAQSMGHAGEASKNLLHTIEVFMISEDFEINRFVGVGASGQRAGSKLV